MAGLVHSLLARATSDASLVKCIVATILTVLYCLIGGLVYSNSEMDLSTVDSICECPAELSRGSAPPQRRVVVGP